MFFCIFSDTKMEVERAIWNEINTDFDPEEETANFGTRHALEAEGNLYEVSHERIVQGNDFKNCKFRLSH